MITYDDRNGYSAVYLNKRRIGTIFLVPGGWQYVPKGSKKNAGEVMRNRSDVKRSLEN